MKYDYLPLNDAITKNDVDGYKTLFKLQGYASSIVATIVIGIIFVALSSYYIFFTGKASVQMLLFFAAIAIFGIYRALKSYKNIKKLREYKVKIWKFANRNSLNYTAENHDVAYDGNIFSKGENRYSYDILNLATSESRPVEIANYRYDIRTSSTDSEGRRTTSTRVYRQGYILINLDRKLPHIILDSKKNGTGSIGNGLLFVNQGQRLELEGDFNDYFDLYVPNGYERDALYIFTPDVMAVFVDETCNFDAEIIDDKLFIYSSAPFNMINQSVLEKLFSLIDLVSKKTLNQAENYADERVDDRQANVIAAEGKRLKFGLPKPIIIIIIAFIALNFLSLIMALLPKS